MNLAEIHRCLGERFGDAIAPLETPERGDGVIQVSPALLHDVCRFLRDDPEMRFDFLRLLSGVDRGESLSSVYHLYSYVHGHEVILRVDVPTENPTVTSVTDLWPAADWLERETFDLMGIVYADHGDLRRILLPDDWQGFPLRKNYEPPLQYHDVPNT